MSLEEEIIELSLVYHGQREYVEELQQLFAETLRHLNSLPYDSEMEKNYRSKLTERAKALLRCTLP